VEEVGMNITAIIASFCESRSVTLQDIIERNRKRFISHERDLLVHTLRTLGNLNDSEISDIIRRERSSVCFAANRIKKRLKLLDAERNWFDGFCEQMRKTA
jgi:chromosomal replication initiation ATPase DnaA